MEDLTRTQIATDFAIAACLSAILYGAIAFFGVSVATIAAGPIVGTTVGVVAGGYLGYHTYEWALEMVDATSLPPTTSIEQRQNSPCHCLLNTLVSTP